MNVLDRILTGVADHASVPSATVQLLHNVAEQVRATAGNAAAAEQLADLVHAQASHIAAQVLANTPVVTATLHPDHAQAIVDKATGAAASGDQNPAA